jgi:hypothetical protein
MKIKDFLNKQFNNTNKQISFNLRKKEMIKKGINIDDIMNTEIKSCKIDFE